MVVLLPAFTREKVDGHLRAADRDNCPSVNHRIVIFTEALYSDELGWDRITYYSG